MHMVMCLCCFNTQPPEGGWILNRLPVATTLAVSTHSRLKAAGAAESCPPVPTCVSTHSRLKAAGKFRGSFVII